MSLEETLRAAVREEVRGALEDLRRILANGGGPVDLLNQKQAAKAVGVSPDTVAGWVRAGLLTPHGAGRLKRYARADLLAALERSKPTEDEAVARIRAGERKARR